MPGAGGVRHGRVPVEAGRPGILLGYLKTVSRNLILTVLARLIFACIPARVQKDTPGRLAPVKTRF